jgi:type IV secretory pathway VirB4 component
MRRLTRRQPTSTVGVVAGWGPDSVHVEARRVRVGEGWAQTLTVVGYPAVVTAGWLEPLLAWPHLDISVHVTPIPAPVAASRLRTQRARLESSRRHRARHERLDDPDLDAAADDAAELAGRLARAETCLFRLALTLTVHAPTAAALDDEVARVRAVCASMLLDVHPATWRALQGWTSTLPVGLDLLGQTRTVDTDALAAAFPFTSPDLPAADPAHPEQVDGVYLGANAASAGVVVHDRWSQPNYNSVCLAPSGAGKSYLTKLEVLRGLYDGVQTFVVDPENEYVRLGQAVGATILPLGEPGVRLNPFDLPGPGHGPADALTRQTLFGHTLLALLLGHELDPAQTAVADRAILGAYHAAGITADPRTWARPAPQLADVCHQLAADPQPAGPDLAGRLQPFTEGSYRSLFDGPTTHRLDSHLVVIAQRDVPDELRAAATMLALDAIWRQITDPAVARRRLVVVDERWQVNGCPPAERYLYRMGKGGRKHHAGLAVVSQDADDLLGTELGQAIVHNAATRYLLRQSPSAIDQIAEVFGLTAGEARLLTSAPPGLALLLTDTNHRVAFYADASPEEHILITTDPTDVDPYDIDPNETGSNDIDTAGLDSATTQPARPGAVTDAQPRSRRPA